MQFSPAIAQLVEALRCLPGVGGKTAQRMAIHLLEKDPQSASRLASSIGNALNKIQRCTECRMLTEQPVCEVCSSDKRSPEKLCIVETVMDLVALEQTSGYEGRYFVLHGRLSPLDGIGPDELQLDQLERKLIQGDVQEVILATSPTVEGEATANYLIQMARKHGKHVSRIAYGVPFGGELEYVDSHTLSHALASRQVV